MRPIAFACFGPLVFSLAGCPTSPTPPPACQRPFLGDPKQPIQIELIQLDSEFRLLPVAGCGSVDIIEPPQGGRVLFIGVRATNVDPCALTLNVALRDPPTRLVLGAEDRTINLTAMKARAGWGESEAAGDFTIEGFRDFANVAVCPNVDQVDVQRRSQLLEVKVEDKAGRKAQASAYVLPRCAQKDPRTTAMCECTCERDYTMERCRDVTRWDAGVPAPAACPPPDGGAGDGT